MSPDVVISTAFSSPGPVRPGDQLTQSITAENEWSHCECHVKLAPKLVDAEGAQISPDVLSYDGDQTHFAETTLVGRAPRKARQLWPKDARAKVPNPVTITRELNVGTPPPGVARPMQVQGLVPNKVQEALSSAAADDGLWEDGKTASTSVLVA